MEGFKRIINLSLVLLCLLLETAVFTYHWYFNFRVSIIAGRNQPFWIKGHMLEVAVYLVILILFSNMYGGMRLGYMKNAELIFSQIFATVMADILIYAEISLMALRLFNPKFFAVMLVEQCILVFIYINIANFFYRNIFPPRRLLLVHGDRDPRELRRKFETRSDKYLITEQIHISEGTKKVCDAIKKYYTDGTCNAVVFGDIAEVDRKPLIKYCYGNSIRFYILPKINDCILKGAEELHVFDSPMLLTREYSMTMEQRFLKRLIDIVFSLILIVISSPFMLITAIAVKAYDGGPVLYKQVRVTRGGKRFNIVKFRSMRVDAEKDGVRLYYIGDKRVTPVGKFIRKVRLDELPQLFNILKGDMSFIGPRPERPEIIEQYQAQMPEFAYRLKVKAGLAGFAQVYGKYNTTPYDKLKLDLIYIENYSVLLDLKLMMLTLKILFWPDSTEGVDPGQTTAMKDLYMAMAENKYEDSESYNEDKAEKVTNKDENTLDV
ncbi:MAG: sugar transferase [Lachnospiraceae bacterium]|nr:sugar transferase [Lachnospiraceae bacterium]